MYGLSLRLVYMYRQSHRFLYRLKMGSMQPYKLLFTHHVKKIKAVAHKNGDIDSTCK